MKPLELWDEIELFNFHYRVSELNGEYITIDAMDTYVPGATILAHMAERGYEKVMEPIFYDGRWYLTFRKTCRFIDMPTLSPNVFGNDLTKSPH